MLEGAQIVVVGCCGIGKLDGHIGRSECRRIEVVLIVYVYDTHNLVATLLGDFLNHVAHFAVTD